jgi:hypothetical protein
MSNQAQFAGLDDIQSMDDDVVICRIQLPGLAPPQQPPLPATLSEEQKAAMLTVYKAERDAWEAQYLKRFRLGVLAYSEYNDIYAGVPDAVVPTKVEGGKRVPWPEAPSYGPAKVAVEDERRRRLMAASLEKGGMTIPGDDLEAKAKWLAERSTAVIAALLLGFTQAHHGMGGRLEALSDGFHGVSDST